MATKPPTSNINGRYLESEEVPPISIWEGWTSNEALNWSPENHPLWGLMFTWQAPSNIASLRHGTPKEKKKNSILRIVTNIFPCVTHQLPNNSCNSCSHLWLKQTTHYITWVVSGSTQGKPCHLPSLHIPPYSVRPGRTENQPFFFSGWHIVLSSKRKIHMGSGVTSLSTWIMVAAIHVVMSHSEFSWPQPGRHRWWKSFSEGCGNITEELCGSSCPNWFSASISDKKLANWCQLPYRECNMIWPRHENHWSIR